MTNKVHQAMAEHVAGKLRPTNLGFRKDPTILNAERGAGPSLKDQAKIYGLANEVGLCHSAGNGFASSSAATPRAHASNPRTGYSQASASIDTGLIVVQGVEMTPDQARAAGVSDATIASAPKVGK